MDDLSLSLSSLESCKRVKFMSPPVTKRPFVVSDEERRNAAIKLLTICVAYTCWAYPTPVLILAIRTGIKQAQGLGVFMFNPDYFPVELDEMASLDFKSRWKDRMAVQDWNSWTSRVHFGRVTNADQVFGRLLPSEYTPVAHKEPSFREFKIDSEWYKDRVTAIQTGPCSERTYPQLIVFIDSPEYSIHELEDLYSTLVYARLVGNPSPKPILPSYVLHVKKVGKGWN